MLLKSALRIAPLALALSLLAACQPEKTEENGGNATTPAPVPAAEPAATTSAPPPAAPAVAACDAPAPKICAGPLVVGLEDVTLQWAGEPHNDGDRPVEATATLTLAGRVPEAVQVALLNGEIALKFANGTVLTRNQVKHRDISGLNFCGFSGDQCVNKGRQSFTTIAPGDSPIRVAMRFPGTVRASQIASLANASTASISLSVWLIHNDPAGEQRTISIGGIAVANSTVE